MAIYFRYLIWSGFNIKKLRVNHCLFTCISMCAWSHEQASRKCLSKVRSLMGAQAMEGRKKHYSVCVSFNGDNIYNVFIKSMFLLFSLFFDCWNWREMCGLKPENSLYDVMKLLPSLMEKYFTYQIFNVNGSCDYDVQVLRTGVVCKPTGFKAWKKKRKNWEKPISVFALLAGG